MPARHVLLHDTREKLRTARSLRGDRTTELQQALAGIGIAVLGAVAGVNSSWAAGVPLIVIGLVFFVIGVTVGSVLRAVFTVVVYRYATENLVAEGFPAEDLEHVFHAKKHRV